MPRLGLIGRPAKLVRRIDSRLVVSVWDGANCYAVDVMVRPDTVAGVEKLFGEFACEGDAMVSGLYPPFPRARSPDTAAPRVAGGLPPRCCARGNVYHVRSAVPRVPAVVVAGLRATHPPHRPPRR